jgi:hypothetical protein
MMTATQASKLSTATKIQTSTNISQDVLPGSYHLLSIKSNRNFKQSMWYQMIIISKNRWKRTIGRDTVRKNTSIPICAISMLRINQNTRTFVRDIIIMVRLMNITAKTTNIKLRL